MERKGRRRWAAYNGGKGCVGMMKNLRVGAWDFGRGMT